MKYFIITCCLLIGTPAWAVPVTFDFAGTIAYQYGTVEGTFTYESTAAPSAYNVHSLTPNVTYALTSWDFTVNNTLASIPSPFLVNFPSTIAFSNILPNNTSEFCIGTCIFSSQPYETLRFYSGEYFVQLAFTIPTSAPFSVAPPDTLEEWGPLSVPIIVDGHRSGGGSSFESPRNYSLLTSGGITGVSSAPVSQPVPEPSTWVMLGVGVLGLLLTQLQRRLRADNFIE